MPLARTLGGMAVALSVPEPAAAAFRNRYPESPAPASADLTVEAGSAWGLRWRAPGLVGADAHAAPALAVLEAIVVAALLRRGALVLHANALSADGGAVLLAGPSGAGKSTLSVLLHRRDPARVRPLAEDVTVLSQNCAQPFARRPSCDARGAAEYAAAFASEPLPVRAVVLLAPEAAHPAEAPAAWRLAWIGAPEEPVAAALGARPRRTEDGIAEVRLAEPPAERDRAAVLAAIRAAGGIVLHVGALRAEGRAWVRPAAPCIEEIPAPQGIMELGAHRAADPTEPADAARAWMDLAAACGGARFLRCVPGGSPDDTARALAEALSA